MCELPSDDEAAAVRGGVKGPRGCRRLGFKVPEVGRQSPSRAAAP